MALQFRSSPSEKIYTADEFLGVDFASEPSKLSSKRSPNAKNMVINKNGYVEKRTGYRRVLETQGNINGMFEYICAQNDTTYHFIHVGTKLYKFSFDNNGCIVLGDELLSGLGDKKSRSFMFGGALYILGAGYIKIGYDEFSKSIAYGFVNKACSVNVQLEAQTIISGRTLDGRLDGQSHDYLADNSYKKIEFAYGWYSFSGSKLYIAPEKYKQKIRVASLYLNAEKRVSEEHYIVESDKFGLYVKLDRTTIEMEKNYLCSPFVIVCYDEFVYAPTVVTNRLPVGQNYMAGYVVDDNGTRLDTFEAYTGETLEAANLASGLRKTEFFCSNEAIRKGAALRLYIGDVGGSKCTVTRIWVDGELVHKYLDIEENVLVMDYAGSQVVDLRQGYCQIATTIVRAGGIITVEYFVDNERDVIDGCDIYALYGGSNDTRVFVSGNKKYPARDFASGLFDASYFSDLQYTDIGSEESAIIGYHKLYGNLIIVKEARGKESAHYLRTFSLTTDDNNVTSALFSVKQGNISYGALNKSSFKSIGGLPLYLGEDGVFGISGTNVENQHNTSCISNLVNPHLVKHENLEGAVCASMGGRYYIFIDDCAYICDAENGFEWFYFDGLPRIKCVWVRDKVMYFGTQEGIVYRFMSEDEDNAYYDNVAVDGSVENAHAIEAIWEIAPTTLNEYSNYKTIRNCYITCMPHTRSSVKVYYNTNEDYCDWVLDENIDLFSFDDVDFNRFTFRTIQAPFVFATGVKVKNIYVFGLRLVNDVAGEPFGFLAASIKYRTGKYVK